MKINELQARQGNVNIDAEVVDKANPREFDKFGKKGKVCNAKIKDETGIVALTLWNDEVDLVDVGDKLRITNGYVGEWQGELQLSAGKFGKIEVVEKIPQAAKHTNVVPPVEKKNEEEFMMHDDYEDVDADEEDIE